MQDVTLIANRYEIQATIGEYSNAHLYRAWDRASEQGVMISLGTIESPLYADAAYQKQERQLMAMLHPQLVRLIHFGVHENRRYLVMPVLAGQPLMAFLNDRPQPFKTVQRWAAAIGSALVYVHQEGMIYQQLSPENIWLDDQYSALLLPMPSPLPPSQTIIGTISNVMYLSPEQIKGEDADAASDQYSLAVVMYQAITGELHHHYDNPNSYAVAVTTGVPDPAQNLRDDVPQNMNDALMKALSKQAQNRYPTITDFIDAFLVDDFFDPSITDTGTFTQVDDDRFGTQGSVAITDEEIEEEPASEEFAVDTGSSTDTKILDIDEEEVDDETSDEGEAIRRSGWAGGSIDESNEPESSDLDDWIDGDIDRRDDKSEADEKTDRPKSVGSITPQPDEEDDEASGWMDRIKSAIDEATEILGGMGASKGTPETPTHSESESTGEEIPEAPSPEPPPPPGASAQPDVPTQDVQRLEQRRSEIMGQLLLQRVMRDQSPASMQEINEEIKRLEAELKEINQLIPQAKAQEQQSLKTAQAQFTAYYARETIAEAEYGLYVYAHLPDALQQVNADVGNFTAELGGTIPKPKVASQSPELALDIHLTVALEIDGLDFEPIAITKKWETPFTRFDFAYTAPQHLAGEIISGRISIQVSHVEIANIPFATLIQEASNPPPVADTMPENPLAAAKFSVSDTAQIYNKIFISYSRRDGDIAENYRLAQLAIGHDVFMDSYSIRSGEHWQAALAAAIDEADIFQLFWSEHSSASNNVRDEWTYALNYRCFDNQCVGFIRPVYWTQPLIDPPQELGHLNFRFVPFKTEV